MNLVSTAGFVPPSVYIGFRLFVLLGKHSGDVSSMLWRVRGRIVPLAHSSVGEQFCSTPPRHPTVRSVATRPWYVRVLDSTGFKYKLDCSCFWGNVEASFLRCLGGTGVSWANSSVGTQSCPIPPGRSAGRPDPTRPWYVRVLDSTGC